MMTLEDARKRHECIRYTIACFTGSKGDCEAVDIAFSALRSPTREQVEKVWRGCDMCNGIGAYDRYAKCLTKTLLAKYCPHCGAPLTDEAVEMVMERLEALHETVE